MSKDKKIKENKNDISTTNTKCYSKRNNWKQALQDEFGIHFEDSKSEFQFLEAFIKDLLTQVTEEARKEITEKLRLRLKYCQEQNGRDYCKNCGLNEDDFIDKEE